MALNKRTLEAWLALILFAIVAILTIISLSHSANDGLGKRFSVGDLLDPAKREQNIFALNQNFEDLWKKKQDKTVTGTSANQVFYFTEEMLSDTNTLTNLAVAINQNFQDLYAQKVDVSSPSGQPIFTVFDISDPLRSNANTSGISSNFDDLWQNKADKP